MNKIRNIIVPTAATALCLLAGGCIVPDIDYGYRTSTVTAYDITPAYEPIALAQTAPVIVGETTVIPEPVVITETVAVPEPVYIGTTVYETTYYDPLPPPPPPPRHYDRHDRHDRPDRHVRNPPKNERRPEPRREQAKAPTARRDQPKPTARPKPAAQPKPTAQQPQQAARTKPRAQAKPAARPTAKPAARPAAKPAARQTARPTNRTPTRPAGGAARGGRRK